jgi:hypothetical protein
LGNRGGGRSGPEMIGGPERAIAFNRRDIVRPIDQRWSVRHNEKAGKRETEKERERERERERDRGRD